MAFPPLSHRGEIYVLASCGRGTDLRFVQNLKSGRGVKLDGISALFEFNQYVEAPLAIYNRAKAAYAVVITGELAKYGNIIIKKGVTPV
ncbi:RbsD/FucU domain-containing protein [Mannheimia pernigra]|uniref:RbsD/FucU domain-containing protein n=1 Tax=Mannheimia pernigra TaxID=111844 RepID=UPI00159F4A9D|nr:hypothetical protein HV561_03595 [Mannheimia pernigra]